MTGTPQAVRLDPLKPAVPLTLERLAKPKLFSLRFWAGVAIGVVAGSTFTLAGIAVGVTKVQVQTEKMRCVAMVRGSNAEALYLRCFPEQ